MSPATWMERVTAERDELAEKLVKLEAFIDSDIFPELDMAMRHTLHLQRYAMKAYKSLLGRRLKLAEEKLKEA